MARLKTSSRRLGVLASRITARTKVSVAVGTGLKVISTGSVAPSRRKATRRVRSAIDRWPGACW